MLRTAQFGRFLWGVVCRNARAALQALAGPYTTPRVTL